METLDDKVSVVTGGASGIGLAMAHSFAGAGMRLVLADVDEAGLHAARAGLSELGATCSVVPTDVSDPAQVESLRDAALSAFGAVHVVCNNAGVAGGGPIWEVPIETWHWVLGVNLFGVVHGIASFVPVLLEQGEGHVVNTASAAGLLVAPMLGPYTASKHAVVAISETLALDLGPAGVGVSVLCPMFVRTRIHEADRNAPPEVRVAEEGRAGSEMLRAAMTSLVEAGIEPDLVGEKVLGAVRENRFWVLPHDDVKPVVRARAERIATEESPALPANLFGGA